MRGVIFSVLLTAIFLNLSCSNSTGTDPLIKRWLRGTVKDSLGNPLSDVKVFLIFHFDSYPITNSGPATVQADSIPDETILFQNYPDPFSGYTFFDYALRKQSNVSFSIYDFHDRLLFPDYLKYDSLAAGLHEAPMYLETKIPSGGYKTVMKVDELDGTVYTREINFVTTYPYFERPVVYTMPNAVSSGGIFRINYYDIPFRQKYLKVDRYKTEPEAVLELNNTFTIVLYDYYHQGIVKDIIIDPEVNSSMDFVMNSL